MRTNSLDMRLASSHDLPVADYSDHSTGKRINTDSVMLQAIRKQYPEKHVTVTPEAGCNLLAYAAAGHAWAMPVTNTADCLFSTWRSYVPPAKRLDGGKGGLYDRVLFGKYQYVWKDEKFVLYVVDGRDGALFATVRNNYLVGEEAAANQLILEVGSFFTSLHDEIWVFDRGFWGKDAELWKSVSNASWDDVILDAEMKQTLIDDVTRFFDSRPTYTGLRVPWKRGIIFHGPPGNGKTISIKATMHTLYRRKDPVATLYVKTLAGYAPPEFMLGQIFNKARQEAPCFLVFEDLDSIVSDTIRSFFLNEVDGLSNNDGILMVGSTNHLEQLDPGISKRPSRFDRKYYFPVPDKEERVKYCEYWQGKLADNKEIEFPHRLCRAIANITDEFSFAYIQEAFVATLLVIAAHNDKPVGNGWNRRKGVRMWQDSSDKVVDSVSSVAHDDLDEFVLWREIKVQIKILREGLEEKEAQPEVQPGAWKGGRHSGYRSPPINRNKAIQDFTQMKAAHLPGVMDVEGRDIETKNFGVPVRAVSENTNVPSRAGRVYEHPPAVHGID